MQLTVAQHFPCLECERDSLNKSVLALTMVHSGAGLDNVQIGFLHRLLETIRYNPYKSSLSVHDLHGNG